MRRARWKRKHVRRVGLRRRSPPAAGGGRLAVPCGSQRRKRAALGETSSPGRYRDTPCPSPRCRSRSREEAGSAWRSGRRGKRSWSNASLHPDAVGTIRHGTAVTTSQKMIACPKASPNRRLHRYADPRQHRGANAPACAKSGLFFWTGRGPFSFRQDRKENGGRIAQPSSWLNPPGRQIAAPAAPPEESPLSGGGEAKKAAGPPASRPAVCLYAKNPLRIRSSASSSVRPRVSSFSS